MASPSAIGSPLLQNQPKGHLWGPDAIMRRAGASDKSKDAFILELYINFVKRISFLDFSVWPWKRCEQPPCPVQPGPRDPRTTRTRRSGRGTREANIVPRNVGGTTGASPKSIFYVAPRLVTCRGRIIMALGRFCRMGASRKQLKGIFLKFGDPGRHGPC